MIRVEALAVIGFGVLLGLAIAAATLLGLGASELPARNALRQDPVEVIGAQQ
jgi:ABC-type lipoprotein release transport system permease subunit